MAVLLSVMFPAKALLAGQEGVDNVRLGEAHPTEICKLLPNKNASEKAQIKSREIAKRDLKGEYTNTQYGVRVEIIGEVKEININGQSGIELFAKAWRGDKQLGFGKDGSVEIERFRIFNPPILVDDPNGDIVREGTEKDISGNIITKQRKLREDPAEAIRQVIAHNVTLVGKDNNNIVKGKVGNTTSTFYPDADPETTSVDGATFVDSTYTVWADARNATTGSVAPTDTAMNFNSESQKGYYNLWRNVFLFDTSPLGSNATISDATFSVYGTGIKYNDGGDTIHLVSSNPASNTDLVGSDYNIALWGSTSFGSKTVADYSVSAYNDMALNADGKNAISKTSITKFGLRHGADINNTAPTGINQCPMKFSDTAGTANDPKLLVVHSAPTPTPTPTITPTPTDTTVVIQPGSEGKDTCYGTVYATSGQPDAETLYMGGWGDWYYDFFEFDLSGSPSANNTVSATLSLYGAAPSDGSDPEFQVNRITESWTESGVKYSSNPASAFYKNFGSFVVSSSPAWNSVDITDLYKSRKSGTYPNYGIKLVPTKNNHTNGSIYSSDNTDSTHRPQLVIVTTPTPTPPLGSVSINSDASYTNSTVVTLTLKATDDVGVIGYYASTSLSTPTASASGWNSVTSATSYSGSVSYTLASGDESKTVYVWYKDAAGNVSSTASDSIILDTTAPIVTITSPTSSDTYTTTSSPLSLSGSASDSSSGISSVTWANSKGGSGATSGTTNWSISNMSLSNGDNLITVTATDNAGNPGKDTITVIVLPPTPTPSPTPTPTRTPPPSPIPTTTITPGIIVGTVADEAAGVGIAGAKITSDKGGYSATTGVDGSYTIENVSAGDYTLTASADGYKPSSRTATIYAGEATVADFLLQRAPGGTSTVFGIVQDEEENPLRGVAVIIEGNNFSDNTETNEDGFFTFENVLSGNYTLTFEKEGYKTQTMDITIGEGEVKDLGIITLEQVETGKVYGYVMNIKGNPIEFVKLRLKGIKTKVIKTASSDADGLFEFTDLGADTYVIFAKKKGYKKTQQKVVLEEGDSTEIEIEMRKSSKRIKGFIQEEDVQ